jgi:hypothetical protein
MSIKKWFGVGFGADLGAETAHLVIGLGALAVFGLAYWIYTKATAPNTNTQSGSGGGTSPSTGN